MKCDAVHLFDIYLFIYLVAAAPVGGFVSGTGRWAVGKCQPCAQPGGCNCCCCATCCMSCAFGVVAGSLQPGDAPCAGNACGACACYAAVGGVLYGAAGLLFCCLGVAAVSPLSGPSPVWCTRPCARP